MKILIISSKINPPFQGPRSFRTVELAKELAKRGNEVVLYVEENDYDYSEFCRLNKFEIKFYKRLKWSTKLFKSNNKAASIVNRIFHGIMINLFNFPSSEYYIRVKEKLKKESSYDLLISIASPHAIHWGVTSSLKKNPKLTKLWIADCGDPFMGDTTNPYPRPFYFKYIEKWFSKRADYITVPVEGAIKGYYKEFHHKIRVIPQGFDLSNLRIFKGNKENKITTFAYAGYLMRGVRDPRPLLEYLESKNYNYKFIIYSKPNIIINNTMNDFGDRIELREPVIRENLIYELGKMDFLINFDNGTDIQVPSKLIDYSLTGTPVLNIFPGEIKDTKIIDEFMNRDYTNRMNLPDSENYNIINVVDKFLKLTK